MSDLPTIAKDLIAMFDSNQVPSHDDNSIITLKNSTNKKERHEKNKYVPCLHLGSVILRTNIINSEWDCKKLSSLLVGTLCIEY